MADSLVESVPAHVLLEQILRLGVTHVVTVPDTHQKTLLEELAAEPAVELLTVATEDEAICVNAGLWMGGVEPMLLIQNVGLFAGLNSLRGMAQDTKTPTCMLVGQFGRNLEVPPEQNRASAVRLIGPLLDSMDVPYYSLDRAADADVIGKAFEDSRQQRGPAAVLVSAPTS